MNLAITFYKSWKADAVCRDAYCRDEESKAQMKPIEASGRHEADGTKMSLGMSLKTTVGNRRQSLRCHHKTENFEQLNVGMPSNTTWKTDAKRRDACRSDVFRRDADKIRHIQCR
jgi:hypothetical protein